MLKDLETKAAAGEAFTDQEGERVLSCPDLISVGILGESARRARHGHRVTYGRVTTVGAAGLPQDVGGAGEVRIVASPESWESARVLVRAVVALAGDVPVTGFSLADLLELAGGDHLVLAEAARDLRQAGLIAVASVPVDRLEDPAEVVRAARQGGLEVWRATVERAASPAERMTCIRRVAHLQRETSALCAFAPLAVIDDAGQPSTGYDDVRTVAVARLMCPHVSSIQVDWSLYGPKLAQVAIAYGADDLDNVAAVDGLGLGHRRGPVEEIERQIAAAFATPAERNARFELRA